ncbi:SDR family NAD(P)-dependent oxidoreductase [Actinomycetes bacterium M1A6_2h]
MSLLTRTVDTLLDAAVVPGYSKIGPAVRRRFWASDPAPFPAPLDVVVTGASSGLGAATTVGLARLGARVHMVGRSATRLEDSAAMVRATVPGADLVIRECDVSDLDAVAMLTTTLLEDVAAVHALVHCAGVMPPERITTPQGHESAFATHVLGPVALTVGLRTVFDDSSRVVFVSSGGMYAVPMAFDDLEYEKGKYKGITAYARTKRMQVVVAEQLAAAFTGDDDPVVHSMHPGWANTPGVTDSLPGFDRIVGPILRSPREGADTIVWLAAGDEALASTGLFWHDRSPRTTHYPPWRKDTPAARDHLWQTVTTATGIELGIR